MALPATVDIVSKRAFRERKAEVIRTVNELGIGFERVLDRHPVPAWGIFSVFYFVWALFVSTRKQLWFDELVSYSVDHVATWGAAWHALQIGVDANPPLFHFVNRTLLAVFGDSTFVQRGSSILGFWVLSLCVYLIVRRNHSAAAAWVAAVIPACSGAAYYATESRPYGMVLGFVAFAIICWLNAIEQGGSRRWWIAGLALSIAAAISSHYYSVFVIFPFLGAELIRTFKRGKLDWAITSALFASYLPLILFWKAGLMSAANQYTGDTDGASLLSPVDFWGFIFTPIVVSILMAVAIALVWKCIAGGGYTGRFEPPRSTSILIGASFCALPIIVVLAARFVTHAYEHRYAITAVIGAAILIGIGFDALRSVVPGAAGLAILSLIFPVAATAVMGRHHPRGRHVAYEWVKIAAREPGLPIVYAGQLEFVQAWFNAPSPELKKRIMTLVDVREARARTGSTTADLGVINLAPAMPAPYAQYAEFAGQRKPFYLIYEPAISSWITQKLIEDGAQLRLLGLYGADEIYRVDWR